MMLPSRSVRKRRANPSAPVRTVPRRIPLTLGLADADSRRAPLATRPGRVVRGDARRVEELQAGVDVGEAGQRTRHLVLVELEHRQEALQVRLLVDREVDLLGGQELRGRAEQVVAAAVHLAGEAVLLDHLREALRGAGVDREEALRALVALPV